MRRGFLEAFGVAGIVALCFYPLLNRHFAAPHGELLRITAQLGATLLVAYGVEASWLLKASRIRGSDRENWVGITCGIGVNALTGIILALGLSTSHGSLTTIEELLLSWSLISIGMLGLLVAVMPWAIYEWVHTVQTEYGDE